MKIKLTRDTIVRFEAGKVLDVSEEEAKRLFAFKNAVPAEEEKPAPKKTKAKN